MTIDPKELAESMGLKVELNPPRYLVDDPNRLLYLTGYVRNHIGECCILLDMTVRSLDKKDYFSVFYLNKDEHATVSFDIK